MVICMENKQNKGVLGSYLCAIKWYKNMIEYRKNILFETKKERDET